MSCLLIHTHMCTVVACRLQEAHSAEGNRHVVRLDEIVMLWVCTPLPMLNRPAPKSFCSPGAAAPALTDPASFMDEVAATVLGTDATDFTWQVMKEGK